MRVAVRSELSESDGKHWARLRSVVMRWRERSPMVLMAADGRMNKAMATALGVDQNKVAGGSTLRKRGQTGS